MDIHFYRSISYFEITPPPQVHCLYVICACTLDHAKDLFSIWEILGTMPCYIFYQGYASL